jgi:superfamily II DNA helicase RecQ
MSNRDIQIVIDLGTIASLERQLSFLPSTILSDDMLPRNSSSRKANAKAKVAKAKEKQDRKRSWAGLTLDDLKNLGQKIKERFKWNHSPREFQLEAIKAQLLRKDVVIHAGTGAGKTFVAAGPHAHEGTEGMVTFMVSPLIALQEEQVRGQQERCFMD